MDEMTWSPAEKPYRVRWVCASNTSLLNGWRDRVEVFATLDEARHRANERVRGGALREVLIDVAVNPETWKRNGRWKRIAKRGCGEVIP